MWIKNTERRFPRFSKKGVLLIFTLIVLNGSAILWRFGLNSKVSSPRVDLLSAVEKSPLIQISISSKNLSEIRQVAAQAIKDGILFSEEHPYVAATLYFNGEEFPAEIRLKGTWSDHYQLPNKLSFRVRLKNHKQIMGMERFSLQSPETRRFIWEWIFQKSFGREGGIALRYDFLRLKVNDTQWGVYAIEEGIDLPVLTNNKRREGPFLKFDNGPYWKELSESWEDPSKQNTETWFSGYGFYSALPIVPELLSMTLKKPAVLETFMVMSDKVEAFRKGKLPSSQVFDVETMSTFLALADIFGSQHANHVNQSRFYANPITSRIEPIAYDTNSGYLANMSSYMRGLFDWRSVPGEAGGKITYLSQLFADDQMYFAYIKKLEKFSASDYLEKLMGELSAELGPRQALIEWEWPDQKEAFSITKKAVQVNQTHFKSYLNPKVGVSAYLESVSSKEIRLTLSNPQGLPIEVRQLSYRDTMIFRPESRVFLPARALDQPLDHTSVTFLSDSQMRWNPSMAKQLVVQYRVYGMDTWQRAFVQPWNDQGGKMAENAKAFEVDTTASFPFIRKELAHKRILILPGTRVIDKPLRVEAGFTLIASPGTHLIFRDGGYLFSKSPINFTGPITVEGSKKGNGILVVGAYRESVFSNVKFLGLSPIEDVNEGKKLTGALTFYEAPVKFTKCTFSTNRNGDDLLNLIHSPYRIAGSSFSDVFADAIDADYSNGHVTDGEFMRVGLKNSNGDAIDLSNSILSASHLRMRNIGDKGLSIGEESQVNADDIKIQFAGIGIAVKDSSLFQGTNISIAHSKVGIAGYIKKSAYKNGRILVTGLDLKDNEKDQSIAPGTHLEIN